LGQLTELCCSQSFSLLQIPTALKFVTQKGMFRSARPTFLKFETKISVVFFFAGSVCNFHFFFFLFRFWHRAVFENVSDVSGYGLDDRGSRVRFQAGAGNVSLHHRVQNVSRAHPASYSMGTRGSFPGGKAAGT
jgi:hypothetical protein